MKHLLTLVIFLFSQSAYPFQGFEMFNMQLECLIRTKADYTPCVKNPDPIVGVPVTVPAEPVVVVKPKTYFVKVEDAFADPMDAYWFHLDEGEEPGLNYKQMAGHANIKLVDIDNDGLPEIIMAHNYGPGKSEYRQKMLPYLDPPQTRFEIYDYQDSKFHNVTDLYFTSEPIVDSVTDQLESLGAEIDINQDGQIDIFFSGNQEDGAHRPAEHGSQSAYLIGLISQFDGTYKIHQFGERKWWHNVKVGRDEQGIPYVVGAGYVENGIYDEGIREGVFRYTDNGIVQNETYYWDHNTNEMITQLNSDDFPDIHAGGMTIMTSRYDDFTDLVVQQPSKAEGYDHKIRTGAWPKQALQAYYLDEPYGEWQKTPIIEVPKEIIGTITFRNWLGIERVEDVYDINGYVARIDRANFNPVCSFSLYKNQPPVIFANLGIQPIPDFEEGMLIREMLENISLPYFVEFQNNELSMVPVEIDDYNPSWDLECIDVNNDGYDDLVSPYQFTNNPNNDFDKVRNISNHVFYINQQDGTFKKLEIPLSERPQLPEDPTAQIARSVIADFDGDGIVDTVFYAFNLTTYNGFEKNATYTGMEDHMQFYKGTGKILEDQ